MSESIKEQKQKLEIKIDELEDSIAQLKKYLRELEEEEQHDAIDKLELFLQQIDHKYDNLKDFWGAVADEIRDFFNR